MFAGVGGFSIGINRAYEKRLLDISEGGRQRDEQLQLQKTRLHDTSESNERQRATCIGMSEIDKYASSVLKYRFPNVKNYGDCTSIKWEDVPDFDLLTGGVPCQAWSIAGKREGFSDLRGTMWWEFTRALKAKQPKWFIAENVKGLLSHDKGKSFEKICEGLCECGYAIDFEVLNAKNFGVPQSRERVFIIGKRLDLLTPESII